MSRHVVFGAGQIGAHVAAQLVAAGREVVVVSRSGSPAVAGTSSQAGDLTDPVFATDAAAGADVVYFCLNAPSYDRWPEEFPPLQRAAVQAATRAGARLVVLDNLYGYGSTGGRPLTETTPAAPTSAKAHTRVAMTADLLEAHTAGTLDVAIGRASDFFGPGVTRSALGEPVVRAALSGGRARVLGDPNLPHSYSYAPDVARALIRLGRPDVPSGGIWHLPVTGACTTRQLVGELFRAAGHRPRLSGTGWAALTAAGWVRPDLRELRHTYHQFSQPWLVDDAKFRHHLGGCTTPLPVAVTETVRWYRTHLTREQP